MSNSITLYGSSASVEVMIPALEALVTPIIFPGVTINLVQSSNIYVPNPLNLASSQTNVGLNNPFSALVIATALNFQFYTSSNIGSLNWSSTTGIKLYPLQLGNPSGCLSIDITQYTLPSSVKAVGSLSVTVGQFSMSADYVQNSIPVNIYVFSSC